MTTQNIESVINPDLQAPLRFPDAYREAYERRLAAIRAVPEDDLQFPNLDVGVCVTTVLGALPEILALREEIATLPRIDQALVDDLQDLAMAAAEANSEHTIAVTPREDIVSLHERALKQREQLRVDANALAFRGLINPVSLKGFRNAPGYRNVALELIDYANLLRDRWTEIAGKTALTAQEIQEAKTLGMQLVEAAGHREQAPAVAAETAKVRRQALTLLVRAYDEVRRAIQFLRWREDDADTIAPSLYAGRGGRKHTTEEEPAAAAAQTTVAEPADVAPVPAAAPIAPGYPGHSAFQK